MSKKRDKSHLYINGRISVGELGKRLKKRGVPRMGPGNVWKRLREAGFLKRKNGYWYPTKKAKELGLFKVMDNDYYRGVVEHTYGQVLITKKGQEFLIDYFCKEGQITMEEYFGEDIIDEDEGDTDTDGDVEEEWLPPSDKIPEYYIKLQKAFNEWDGGDDGYNFDERDEETGLILNFPGRELNT